MKKKDNRIPKERGREKETAFKADVARNTGCGLRQTGTRDASARPRAQLARKWKHSPSCLSSITSNSSTKSIARSSRTPRGSTYSKCDYHSIPTVIILPATLFFFLLRCQSEKRRTYTARLAIGKILSPRNLNAIRTVFVLANAFRVDYRKTDLPWKINQFERIDRANVIVHNPVRFPLVRLIFHDTISHRLFGIPRKWLKYLP